MLSFRLGGGRASRRTAQEQGPSGCRCAWGDGFGAVDRGILDTLPWGLPLPALWPYGLIQQGMGCGVAARRVFGVLGRGAIFCTALEKGSGSGFSGAALPCGARGAVWVRGDAACPVGARALWEGARPVLGVWKGGGGRDLFTRRIPRFGRAGLAAEGGVSFPPGCFPVRRGYGGRRPHPLKGLVP